MHFRKSNICAKKLDVQETDFSFRQFCIQVLRMDGMPAIDLWAFGCRGVSFFTKPTQ